MLKQITHRSAARWLLAFALFGFGLASFAQSEPTITEIYKAAQSGRLEQAQTMIQQVLKAHPKSGKAHFVAAEIDAQQGQTERAREALAQAESLAPGLPFAKPEAVQALRAQLAPRTAVPASVGNAVRAPAYQMPSAPVSQFPWGLALALGGAAIGLGIYLSNRKKAQLATAQPVYASNYAAAGGLNGPQSFGMGGSAGMPQGMAPGYGQAPVGSGMGGRLMGGLATGLAVGAGVLAAESIGKSLMGGGEHGAAPSAPAPGAGYVPFDTNADMGGADFGVKDAASWDDGANLASGDGDGGDWDS